MSAWRTRLAALAGACFLGAVAREILRLSELDGLLHSPLKLLAFSMALIGLASTLLAAIAPAVFLAKLRPIGRFASRIVEPPPVEMGRWSYVIATIAAVVFTVLVVIHWRRNNEPTGDELAYLSTAAEIHASGGPISLIRDLYAGQFAEANRHPLYLGLLSLHPTFQFGKCLSIAIGMLAWGVLSLLIARRWGAPTGAAFGLLLAVNHAFLRLTADVVCEGLLLFWIGLAWYLSTPNRGRSSKGFGVARGLVIGAVWGVAYLTKGTAVVFLAGFLLWRAWEMWRRRAARPLKSEVLPLAACLLSFLIVASPLLVRNAVRFGNPLYNVNSYLLFVDSYEDPESLAQSLTLAEARRAYFATHRWTDMLDRESSGIVWETFIIARQLGPYPFDDSRVVLGLPLVLLSLLGAWRSGPADLSLLAIWLVVSFFVFAWYIPIAAGERFPLPLIVPLLAYAADALCRATTRIAMRTR